MSSRNAPQQGMSEKARGKQRKTDSPEGQPSTSGGPKEPSPEAQEAQEASPRTSEESEVTEYRLTNPEHQQTSSGQLKVTSTRPGILNIHNFRRYSVFKAGAEKSILSSIPAKDQKTGYRSFMFYEDLGSGSQWPGQGNPPKWACILHFFTEKADKNAKDPLVTEVGAYEEGKLRGRLKFFYERGPNDIKFRVDYYEKGLTTGKTVARIQISRNKSRTIRMEDDQKRLLFEATPSKPMTSDTRTYEGAFHAKEDGMGCAGVMVSTLDYARKYMSQLNFGEP
ncbi:MAG: hypothetical protein Q9162_006529 [Coniocarpon cinnabarinum]